MFRYALTLLASTALFVVAMMADAKDTVGA